MSPSRSTPTSNAEEPPSPSGRVAAGWFADPTGRHEHRFWDGSRWTPAVADGEVVTNDDRGLTAAQAPEPAEPIEWDLTVTPLAAAADDVRARRRRLAVLGLLALMTVLAVVAALLVWRPWSPAAPSAPERLRAGPVTTSSVRLHWGAPSGGATPATFLVQRNGVDVGSTAGSVSTFVDTGLDPATTYRYQVVAMTSGGRSAPSATLVVTTRTPALATARLQGAGPVVLRVTSTGGGSLTVGERLTGRWLFRPACPTGACTTLLVGAIGGGKYASHPFQVTLTRDGGTYTGATTAQITNCGDVAVTNSVSVALTVRGAAVSRGVWAVDAWTADVTLESPYTAAGGRLFCPAQTVTAAAAPAP